MRFLFDAIDLIVFKTILKVLKWLLIFTIVGIFIKLGIYYGFTWFFDYLKEGMQH